LVRGLLAEGARAHVLWTCHHHSDQKQIALPADLPVVRLPVKRTATVKQRWRAMIAYLEERGPCIYLPNHDYLHSWVVPKLSPRIGIIGNIHSDCEEQYEQFRLQSPYWNGVVVGSEIMAQKAAALCPAVASRIVEIPYGVVIPDRMPERAPTSGRALRVLYAGRLVQWDKRVLDLPKIVEALRVRGVPVVLTVTGKGKDEEALKTASQHLVDKGLIRFAGLLPEEAVPRVYERNDVFILTSNFEGKPLGLVEAMGRGCVPVVTDIPSGVPDLVHEGESGYRVPVGAIDAFADRLAALHADPALRLRLARNAFAVVDQGGYRIQDMALGYLELFRRATKEAQRGVFRRPRGRIVLPPIAKQQLYWVPTWKDLLPKPIRQVGSYCKRLLAPSGSECASGAAMKSPSPSSWR
jgi:glycosyltransferase involved in cell wall biosynthesis